MNWTLEVVFLSAAWENGTNYSSIGYAIRSYAEIILTFKWLCVNYTSRACILCRCASSYDSVNLYMMTYIHIAACVLQNFLRLLEPKVSSFHAKIQFVILYSAFSFSWLAGWSSVSLGKCLLTLLRLALMIHKLGMPVNPKLSPRHIGNNRSPETLTRVGREPSGTRLQVSGSGLGKLNSKNLFRMEVGG